MNAEKSNFNSYIYTLVLDFFYALFINYSVKFAQYAAQLNY